VPWEGVYSLRFKIPVVETGACLMVMVHGFRTGSSCHLSDAIEMEGADELEVREEDRAPYLKRTSSSRSAVSPPSFQD
jgi:hypothetical protein